MVLMLKLSVGLITLVSSPLIFKTMVVFPELSSPLQSKAKYSNIFSKLHIHINMRFWRVYTTIHYTYTMSIRISFSFLLIFRIILSSPIAPAASNHCYSLSQTDVFLLSFSVAVVFLSLSSWASSTSNS